MYDSLSLHGALFPGSMAAWWVAAAALLVAWAWDGLLGEPGVRWHPVVWMGNFLTWAGAQVQRHAVQQAGVRDWKAFGLGAIFWIAGAAMFCIASWYLQRALLAAPWWLAALGMGMLLKPMLAWALLRSEVQAVEAALGESLQAGRARLRYLVSRNVDELSASEVRESAIETLAENLNDSVVAPIFWFVLLGLPGAVLFRFANTADAMWGYPGLYPHGGQGRNWAWAGKWAAHVDDVLGWVPARITALLLMLVGKGRGLRQLPREAARTPSPNSGWPMAAMALVLDVRLAKPGGYVLHAQGRAATPEDTRAAIFYASKSVLALMFIAVAAMSFIAIGVRA